LQEYVESDKARSVRLLLSKHPDQVSQVLQLNRLNPSSKLVRSNETTSSSAVLEDLSDEFTSAAEGGSIPGDSYPTTANHLVAFSMDEIDEASENNNDHDEDEQELLKRLGQGQARMEQIKRMLVNQRGFIVQALKQLAETNSSNRDVRQRFSDEIKDQKEAIERLSVQTKTKSECSKCTGPAQQQQDSADDEASIEKDRTLGKGTMVNFGFNDSSSEEWPDKKNQQNGIVQIPRMCPMCEAAFSTSVTEEDFELHVMEHFSFEEAETLRYIPPTPAPEQAPTGNGYN
jgi:hypothetical protein